MLVLLALLVLPGGCGYQQGAETGETTQSGYQWRSIYRDEIQTVAVPIFQTRDFTRGVELDLSKAIANQIEAHTPYKVVPRERADTILEGEVVAIRVSTLSRDRRSAVPQEQLMGVTVHFTWKDLRTGRILVQRRHFEQTTSFYPTLGESRFVGNQQAVERLALAIVQEMQADW